MDRADSSVNELMKETCRAEYGKIVSVVARVLEDMEAAEDVVQGAIERALRSWPERGVPTSPGAWLTTVARRIAIDRLRRNRRETRLAENLMVDARNGVGTIDDPYELLSRWPDERLQLIATCCHPGLKARDRTALTLREVVGLTIPEIARAFLVSESAMTARLTRARRLLREQAGRYASLEPEEISDRLPDVQRVIYLIFSQGYVAGGAESLMRRELCEDAIWLGRTLLELITRHRIPDRESRALLSLMILLHSRTNARLDEEGLPVLLPDQDRSRWDQVLAREGLALLDGGDGLQDGGPYEIQASVQAVHAIAADSDDTDWRSIDRLYQRLFRIEPGPIVALNGVVAMGMWRGAQPALSALDTLEQKYGDILRDYPWFHAARAHFAGESGDADAARSALQLAHKLSSNGAERALLARRLAANSHC